ncbi:MAG: hypothetical protein J7L82_01805, partial [Staphylothermus sp.]|nr:hypothetical protein [Staphylothermus sp.]
MTKGLGFIFIPPRTEKIYYVVRKRGNNYYVYDLSMKKYKPYIDGLNRELRDLYVGLGGKELRLFNIPAYEDVINTLIKIGNKIQKDSKRRDKGVPEYVVFTVRRSNDERVIFIIDLRGLDEDHKDIPLAWNYEEAGKGFPETFCFVIGYRDVLKYVGEKSEDEETAEGVAPGKVSKRIFSCPLIKVLGEASNSDILINYMAKICKRIHRCKNLEENKKLYRMRGTDVLNYVIQTRSALTYKFLHPQNIPNEKYTLSSIIEVNKYNEANITLELRGFKLELRKYPMIYVGTFDYDKSFRFKSTIDKTKAIEFSIDARWLVFHYLYYINKDPYLRLLTALKALLIDKAKGFVPNPARALYYDPKLSISKLGKTIERYLNDPEELTNDLNDYVNSLVNITIKDRKLLNLIETIAIHTFAHLIYIAFLQMLDTDEDEIGVIIDKEYSKNHNAEEITLYPFDEFLEPKIYKIIIYEKADSGLGYFDKNIHELMNDLYKVFEKLNHNYIKISNDLLSYRQDIRNHYYEEIQKTIEVNKFNEVKKLLSTLEKLSKSLLLWYSNVDSTREYTLLPGWLVRYGIRMEHFKLTSEEKSFLESTMWLILDSLYDLYWDVSPYDLIVKRECIYPDLIRYFTLSRAYAVHLLSDLIKNYKSPYFVANPLTKKAGEIFDKIKHGSIEHVFYTPWIDKQGKQLIENILYHPSSEEIYVVVREHIREQNIFNHPNIKSIVLKEISSAPLHAKLYANADGEVIITSQNLLRTSLRDNIENYSYFIDHILARALIAFTKTLHNSVVS